MHDMYIKYLLSHQPIKRTQLFGVRTNVKLGLGCQCRLKRHHLVNLFLCLLVFALYGKNPDSYQYVVANGKRFFVLFCFKLQTSRDSAIIVSNLKILFY